VKWPTPRARRPCAVTVKEKLVKSVVHHHAPGTRTKNALVLQYTVLPYSERHAISDVHRYMCGGALVCTIVRPTRGALRLRATTGLRMGGLPFALPFGCRALPLSPSPDLASTHAQGDLGLLYTRSTTPIQWSVTLSKRVSRSTHLPRAPSAGLPALQSRLLASDVALVRAADGCITAWIQPTTHLPLASSPNSDLSRSDAGLGRFSNGGITLPSVEPSGRGASTYLTLRLFTQ
jgi:hypothetical protein